jgi:hypothetical protein
LSSLDNRGIGRSTDNGRPFDIAQLADDATRVIEMFRYRAHEFARMVDGWFYCSDASRCNIRAVINKLVLLSTDPGGADADRASTAAWSQLVDMSGTPQEQARRLLSLVFPSDIVESIYCEFGDIVAAARAQVISRSVKRQTAAMDAWHRTGVGNRLRNESARANCHRAWPIS